MKTLTYTSFLGIFCLLLEAMLITLNVSHWRKYISVFVFAGLASVLFFCAKDWNVTEVFFNNMIKVDNFSTAFSVLLIALTALLILLTNYFYDENSSKLTDFISIKIFALSGALAMLSFANITMFFIGLEILSISLYILAASNRNDPKSNEAGMKYFLMGAFASGVLLFGIALIYGVTGTFDTTLWASFVFADQSHTLFYLGLTFVFIAMLFKVSAFPFQFWTADVYDGAPTLTTAFMATVAKIAAVAAFYKLAVTVFPSYSGAMGAIFVVIIALTMLVGNFMALTQDSFKRMMAFSGISNAGFMLITILCAGNNANDLLYYATAYGFGAVGVFTIAILVEKAHKNDSFDTYNGLGKTNPLLAVMLTLFMFSLAGIPPFAGFFAKYFVLTAAIKNGHLLLSLFAIVNSIVAVYYYLKVVVAMWAKEPGSVKVLNHPVYIAVALCCLLIILLIGLSPSLVIRL